MKPVLSSNRSFGWLFTGLLLLAGAWHTQPWLIGLAALTALITALRQQWLTPLNRAWMKLGDLLGRVVSPIVLGAIFFLVFMPVGLVMRMAGRDAMKRRWERAAPTYWVEREPPGPADDSFQNMF